jgi:hypothetical protein
MIGFKGFDNTLKCRDFQYELGKTYTHKGTVNLCFSGFHFCENPFDVWSYYGPTNRFAQVEAEGVSKQTESDSKRVAKTLHIEAELTLPGFIGAGVKFILDKADFETSATNTGNYSAATNTGDYSAATNTGNYSAATNTGDYSAATNTGNYSAATNTGYYSAATNTGYQSAATNTGYQSAATNTGNYSAATNTGYQSAATNTGNYSAATNTGDYSAATNTGNYSAATNTGKNGFAINTGVEGKASGALGCYLTLAEWRYANGEYKLITAKTAKVDGLKIKADTFYTLKGGKFVEAA